MGARGVQTPCEEVVKYTRSVRVPEASSELAPVNNTRRWIPRAGLFMSGRHVSCFWGIAGQ